MKVLQINTVYGEGSTGRIAKSIHDRCKQEGIDCITAYRCRVKGRPFYEDTIEISTVWDSRIHGWLSRFTMLKGFGSNIRTAVFLQKIRNYKPDIIHLHNLHGSYININLLFRYIKSNNIPVVWTLHDCWPFTAICSHFVMEACERWKEGCFNCPQKKRFSSAVADITPIVWRLKKKVFTGMNKAVIVTPSNWMADLVEESFLREYEVKTVPNGIDIGIFRRESSNFRKEHHLEEKKIVLGVAYDWSYAKGIDVFSCLAQTLGEEYKVVLVGTNENTEKQLPEEILSIRRTGNQRELAEIYAAADVFVNPTREDTFPTVNMEALACGTPVVTFDTGGSGEIIDHSCGTVIKNQDIKSMKEEIIHICTQKPFSPDNCRGRAEKFISDETIRKYIDIYKNILCE